MSLSPSELAELLFDQNHQDLVTHVLEEHKDLLDPTQNKVFISRFAYMKHAKTKKAEEHFITNLDAFNESAILAHASLGSRIQQMQLEVKHLQEKWKNKQIDFENDELHNDFQRIIFKKTKMLLSEFSKKLMNSIGDEIVLSQGNLKDRLNPSYFIRWKFYFTYSLNSSKYTEKETRDRSLKEDRSRIRKCIISMRSRIPQNDKAHISFQLGRKKTKEAIVYLQKDFKTWKLTYKKSDETGWHLDTKSDRFNLFSK
ncbi:MAG: hypothetical protein FJZ67_09665 [Bacteroidetes bacterium]|nr:hypothetical protein [Bacteroidota bacterium]